MERGKKGTSNKQEDTVIDHLIDIGRYGCALKASGHVIERAQTIFRQLMQTNGSLRKRNHCAIYAACLYVAGRQHDEMKTLEEVAEKSSVVKKDIFKALQFINRIVPDAACPTIFLTASLQSQRQQLPADVNAENGRKDNVEVRPELLPVTQRLKAHTRRLCNVLNFDSEQAKCAEEMAIIVANSNFGLFSLPVTQAAAIVWICSLFTGSNEVDINLIAEHATGKISIRKTYKLLIPHLPKLLPKHILGETKNWKEKLRLP